MNDIHPTLEETLIPPPEQETPLDPGAERRRRRTARLLGLGTFASLGLVVGIGAWQHAHRAAATIATLEAARTAVPVVRVAVVKAMIDRCRSICRGPFRRSTAPLCLPARAATLAGAMSISAAVCMPATCWR